ncbi:MAG: iron-sulfur cluster assembly protein IscA [Pseudomonadota bacterium]
MAISLSAEAAKHVKQQLLERGQGLGIRVAVKTTGCSGLAYVLEYADDYSEDDQVFNSNDVNIIVDPKSLVYVDGTQMDFIREGLNEGFRFTNPNMKGECGCGESFTV